MAYIDLIPSTVTASSINDWRGISNLRLDDNVYAICTSALTSPLYLEFYSGTGSSNPLVPPNSTITGVQVFFSARVSGAASGKIEFNMYLNSSRTLVGSAIQSIAFSNSEVSSSVGSSGTAFQFPIQWIDLNSMINGRQLGNPWFGVMVKSASSTPSAIWIDTIYARIHYTTATYLNGSRGKFHLGREDLGYDVDMINGIASGGSYIKQQNNGTDSSNQVKANDVNLLGDALYNIEDAILASSGFVYALDLKKTYVFALTVSAYCDSANAYTDAIVYGKIRNKENTISNTVNLYNAAKSVAPNVSGTVSCFFTSAIAWVENGTTRTPMYASAQGAKFAKSSSGIDFVVGLTALASSVGTVADYDISEATVNAYQGYIGTVFTTPPSSGKIFFKVFALGRDS